MRVVIEAEEGQDFPIMPDNREDFEKAMTDSVRKRLQLRAKDVVELHLKLRVRE